MQASGSFSFFIVKGKDSNALRFCACLLWQTMKIYIFTRKELPAKVHSGNHFQVDSFIVLIKWFSPEGNSSEIKILALLCE